MLCRLQCVDGRCVLNPSISAFIVCLIWTLNVLTSSTFICTASATLQIAVISCFFFHMEISQNGKIVESVIKVLNDLSSCCLASCVCVCVCHSTRQFNVMKWTKLKRNTTSKKQQHWNRNVGGDVNVLPHCTMYKHTIQTLSKWSCKSVSVSKLLPLL